MLKEILEFYNPKKKKKKKVLIKKKLIIQININHTIKQKKHMI